MPFFSFLYLKKIKFQKYMPNREIFKNVCLSPPLMGDRVPVAHPEFFMSPTGWATGTLSPIRGATVTYFLKISLYGIYF